MSHVPGCRGGRIRTCNILVPNQTRYQVAPHLDDLLNYARMLRGTARCAYLGACDRVSDGRCALRAIRGRRPRRGVIVAMCCAQPPTRAYAPTGAFATWGGGAAAGGAAAWGGSAAAGGVGLQAGQRADARGAADQRGAGTGASTHGCCLPSSCCCLREFLSTPSRHARQAFIVDFFRVPTLSAGPGAGC